MVGVSVADNLRAAFFADKVFNLSLKFLRHSAKIANSARFAKVVIIYLQFGVFVYIIRKRAECFARKHKDLKLCVKVK